MTKSEVIETVEEKAEVAPAVKKEKKPRKKRVKKLDADGNPIKRKPTAYSIFIRDNYSKVRDLPNKQRFKALSVMWKEEKAKKTAPSEEKTE
jgi:hypothetical protein